MKETYTRCEIINMLNKISLDVDQHVSECNRLANLPENADEKEYFIGRKYAWAAVARIIEDDYLEKYLERD